MRCLDRFRRDETGALTIEFVLWVPLFMALLVIVIDATTIYVTHTEMWNVARDTARRMVTGHVENVSEAEAYAHNALNLRQLYNYDVDIYYEEDVSAEVIIRFGVADMSILGYGSPMTLFGGTMWARVIMRPAPNADFDFSSSGGSGG